MLTERIDGAVVPSRGGRLVVALAVAASFLAGSGSAQGQTPEAATTPAPAPSAAEATPDLTPPQLRGLHLLRRHWSVEDRDTALAARVWPHRGTGMLFTASEPGVVIVRVQREARGDRMCRTHCHRFRTVVTLTRQFDTTPSCFWYGGRVAGLALRPGRHRFLEQAMDAAGNRTETFRLPFTILRHRT
jgi:hypothetical protein